MIDQIIKSINVIEDSESSLIKATQNLVNAKKYLKEGRGSLFSRAEQMRNLGANNKKDLNWFISKGFFNNFIVSGRYFVKNVSASIFI